MISQKSATWYIMPCGGEANVPARSGHLQWLLDYDCAAARSDRHAQLVLACVRQAMHVLRLTQSDRCNCAHARRYEFVYIVDVCMLFMCACKSFRGRSLQALSSATVSHMITMQSRHVYCWHLLWADRASMHLDLV